MSKRFQIFDELMEGFRDAIARKKGRHVALRVTEIRLRNLPADAVSARDSAESHTVSSRIRPKVLGPTDRVET